MKIIINFEDGSRQVIAPTPQMKGYGQESKMIELGKHIAGERRYRSITVPLLQKRK